MNSLRMREWEIAEVAELQEEERLPQPNATGAPFQDVALVCSQSPQEKDYHTAVRNTGNSGYC